MGKEREERERESLLLADLFAKCWLDWARPKPGAPSESPSWMMGSSSTAFCVHVSRKLGLYRKWLSVGDWSQSLWLWNVGLQAAA